MHLLQADFMNWRSAGDDSVYADQLSIFWHPSECVERHFSSENPRSE